MSSSQDEYRFKIFEENVKAINEHNSKLDKPYTMGINRFTGFTEEEFFSAYLSPESYSSSKVITPSDSTSIKLNIDWVSQGAVSMVKDQGSCLADYAFSTVGGIEGLYWTINHQLVDFSAAEIVDCSRSYGNGGCN